MTFGGKRCSAMPEGTVRTDHTLGTFAECLNRTQPTDLVNVHDENRAFLGSPPTLSCRSIESVGELRRKQDDLGRWQYLGADGSWYLSSDDGPIDHDRRPLSARASWLHLRWGVGIMLLVALTVVILDHSSSVPPSQSSAHVPLKTKSTTFPASLTPPTTVPLTMPSAIVPTAATVSGPTVLSSADPRPTSPSADVEPKVPVQATAQIVTAPAALPVPSPSPTVAQPTTSEPPAPNHPWPPSSSPATHARSDPAPWPSGSAPNRPAIVAASPPASGELTRPIVVGDPPHSESALAPPGDPGGSPSFAHEVSPAMAPNPGSARGLASIANR
jgi:hypothetical protein